MYDYIVCIVGDFGIVGSGYGRREYRVAGSADRNLGNLPDISGDQNYLRKKEVTERGPPNQGVSFLFASKTWPIMRR